TGSCVVVALPSVIVHFDWLSKVRGIDHLSGSDVDPHVVDVAGRAVEDEVAGCQRGVLRNLWASVVLLLRGSREVDPCCLVGGHGQSRAVEASVTVLGSVSSPNVGQSELSLGVVH